MAKWVIENEFKGTKLYLSLIMFPNWTSYGYSTKIFKSRNDAILIKSKLGLRGKGYRVAKAPESEGNV